MKDAYPTLFRTASHKNATVVDLWEEKWVDAGVGRINVEDRSKIGRWRRLPIFLELFHPLKVQGRNTLIWKDDKWGNFSVKLYYISLRPENNLVFPGKKI